jgi:PAS domain S-box-containing protein
MAFQDLPIKRKVTSVIMLTSVIVLVLSVAAFMITDVVTFRETLREDLTTSASITANASSAALLFHSESGAEEILGGLQADRNITAAALYDLDGNLFMRYPTNKPIAQFPPKAGPLGVRRTAATLEIFTAVAEGDKPAGSLYLQSSLEPVYHRLRVYALLGLLVLGGAILVAYGISSNLQRRITQPILALANSARAVSERRDYSIRAKKMSNDELGFLTDSYNLMLARIQEQTVALREREDQLRLTIEASRAGSWNWDLRADKIVWDDFLHQLYGLKPGEFQGTLKQFIELVYSDDREIVNKAISETIEKKTDLLIEFRAMWPDGSIHHLGSRGRVFLDESGTPNRFAGLTFDITERKKAEEARSYLAAIVNSSDDAITGKSLSGNIVSWNAGAERMFGFTEVEMLGKPITRLLSPDRPDEELQVLDDVKRGETRHFETVRIRKDGLAIDVSVTISPIKNAAGQLIGLSSIARDITERRRSQAALERHAAVLREQAQMLDLANVMARDLQDHIILWNSGMEKMYGWTRAEALGSSSHELFRSELPEPLDAIKAKLFREGRWEGEVVHFSKTGHKMIVSSQWVLHRDARGEPAAILEVNNDITERRQAEEEIVRMNQQLEARVEERTAELIAANRELEAFTYSVAHDLRAPLRHIDAFARILNDDFAGQLPDEARRYLENIRHGSRNMSRLVDDLLNLARVGRQELKRQIVPLSGLVNEVLSELKNETRERTIEWHIEPLPAAECDSGLMKQVFANLLSNAVKYTRPRKVAVIEVGSDRHNGQPTFFVRDNGVGFNMKYADKLFGVFQRLHRAEEFEGTGVGLATVDRIVRKHGGTVWAEAAVDKGATFFFTIPSTHS